MSDEKKNLNEQLKARAASVGNLTSADVAAALSGDDMDAAASTGPVRGDARIDMPTKEYDVPLVDPVSRATIGAGLTDINSTHGDDTLTDNQPDVPVSAEMLTAIITEEERDTFIEAMINGERFVLPFSTLGGRLTGTIRSRTQSETAAIIARLQYDIRQGDVTVDAEYIARRRAMVLTAQIAELNGVERDTLTHPLTVREDKDGNLVDPGWLAQLDKWLGMDEARTVILHEEVRKFEVKYWMLTRQAEDQNFWQPATST